jgi:hypothetical protein
MKKFDLNKEAIDGKDILKKKQMQNILGGGYTCWCMPWLDYSGGGGGYIYYCQSPLISECICPGDAAYISCS